MQFDAHRRRDPDAEDLNSFHHLGVGQRGHCHLEVEARCVQGLAGAE